MEENPEIAEQDELQQQVIPLAVEDHVGNTETTNSPSQDMISAMPVLLAEIKELRQDFETKVKYDESKERLIDTLHKELQTYREGLHFKILRPIFIDLITMFDDLQKVIDTLQIKSPLTESQEMQNLQSFQETIEEILYRNGVEVFEAEGDMFLANRQRVLKVIETADSVQDKRVARRVRKGFCYENRVLRPEIVEIYKFSAV